MKSGNKQKRKLPSKDRLFNIIKAGSVFNGITGWNRLIEAVIEWLES